MKHPKFTFSISALLLSTALTAATVPAFAEEDITLEEIIVTAQKREQSLIDVPVSVSVVSGERMKNLLAGGADIRALAGRVPGLNAESSNGRVAPRFYIRGLGNTDFDLAASQPVSIIMDDVVMENVVLKSFPLFDIERVEVLRGPQGTLFGKNTPAGIVKFDTVKPSQEASGYANLNIGTLSTVEAEAAYGGPINENLSYRVSGLIQHRGDWVDNGYRNLENVMGGFTEKAFRVQLLLEDGGFSSLFNFHARDNDGTATLFRANVLSGSNELNENYDRDVVYFDEGDNNPQNFKGWGMSAKVAYDFDTVTLTSVTAYDEADGSSLGDIDGGYGAVYLSEMGPGFIPFTSATQDRMDGTTQFTQEIRLSSNTDAPVQYQTGFYYFESDLSVTTFPFFVTESTVTHTNNSWALFGHIDADIMENTTLSAGVRFTEDEKAMEAFPGWADTILTEEVFDDNFSWDIALNHKLSDTLSVYSRLATGFRAPTIQGRDIAFFGAASVATSETILSGELGFKATLLDNTMRVNGAIYKWAMEDQQISAVGGGGNLIQLINVPHTNGYGAEFDVEWLVNENLYLTAGAALTETEIESGLLVGTCAQCTIVDPLRGGQNGSATYAQASGNPLPQAPNWSLNFTANYTQPLGAGELFIFTDWFVEGEKSIFIYDSLEFNTNGDFEGNLRIGYSWGEGTSEVAFYVKNITDESNIKGGIDFNNNTAFVNDPRTFGISFRTTF